MRRLEEVGGEPVNVRGRRRPIELLFNLENPDVSSVVTEVDEDALLIQKSGIEGSRLIVWHAPPIRYRIVKRARLSA